LGELIEALRPAACSDTVDPLSKPLTAALSIIAFIEVFTIEILLVFSTDSAVCATFESLPEDW
jgi:hypothetical protein